MSRNESDLFSKPSGPGDEPPDDEIYFLVRRLTHRVEKLDTDLAYEKLWHTTLNEQYLNLERINFDLDDEIEKKQDTIDGLRNDLGKAEGKADKSEKDLEKLKVEAGKLRDEKTTALASAEQWENLAGKLSEEKTTSINNAEAWKEKAIAAEGTAKTWETASDNAKDSADAWKKFAIASTTILLIIIAGCVYYIAKVH